MATLTISIRPRRKKLSYGETIVLEVVATNGAHRPLYVVTQRVYHWKAAANQLMTLVGQPPIPEYLDYYNFIPPRLARVAPGATKKLHFTLGMPPVSSIIENDRYTEQEQSISGKITLALRLG